MTSNIVFHCMTSNIIWNAAFGAISSWKRENDILMYGDRGASGKKKLGAVALIRFCHDWWNGRIGQCESFESYCGRKFHIPTQLDDTCNRKLSCCRGTARRPLSTENLAKLSHATFYNDSLRNCDLNCIGATTIGPRDRSSRFRAAEPLSCRSPTFSICELQNSAEH